MEKNKISKIIKQIYKNFSEFKDVKPLITDQIITPQTSIYRKLSIGAPKAVKKITRLKFKKKVYTRDRAKLERILIVTLDEKGQIMKTSMSK
ncbi:hypothetical protein A2Y85_01495 [candidate division WOR-3 bacterium RBG_13_43_14]|uniref:Uncharacterized protein n=1 Tax=candidate division WOR-3 bacterium RBG_13_43_14 TaxID=1802590 RepID=A0A1F4UB63_UNCW3|nr:MAG: hypothetical protein A2Y85_01495 [candidate division WOR-3 bacterium RBG_13_43_14]